MCLRKRALIILISAIFVGGCYEDTAEITLNPDGSGTIRQKIVFSERLLVATQDGGKASSVPETDKEALIKKIDKAIDITSITQKDTSDGGRIVELEGTFNTPEQFFLSNYCREQIKLRLAPADESQAQVYCDMSMSGDIDLEVTQLYGLAKGLFIKRTIHLPGEIEKTNGVPGQRAQTVSWITDLRNKDALEQTKQFIEGPGKGEGFAIFDASSLSFSLPLKIDDILDIGGLTRQESSSQVSTDANGLSAKVTYISVNKKKPADGNGISEVTGLEIGVELVWDEDSCPLTYSNPVLLNIIDDLNNDLVKKKSNSGSQRQLFSTDKRNMKKVLTVEAEVPGQNASSLKQIDGYVEVVTDNVQEKVVLDNIQELAGKESTGNAILDALNFRVTSIEGRELKFEYNKKNDEIASLKIFRKDGKEINRSSSMSMNNKFTYQYRDGLSQALKCELEVIVSENRVKVPFSLEEMSLP